MNILPQTNKQTKLEHPVYVVFRAGSKLLVIKMAGSVYSVPVSENVKAGRAEIVEYFVMISIKPG